MAIPLNRNITILLDSPIVNSKASEVYVSVRFTYADYIWEGYVPIDYRRTGTSIDFEDKEKLYPYLNMIYIQGTTAQFWWYNCADRFFVR